ncbi:NACHT, LRR and PYD domains-containing protein 3-like [Leuresthes tenuis]|uniref:NACHT, LRR and PYD domains-containing protein 3-like n=1 Tax=Leuresthes tenuis TaxID=355514 RepID=UPI003B508B57
MFMIDWANGNSNKDIDLVVPFEFSELNARKDDVTNMETFLTGFLSNKDASHINYDKYTLERRQEFASSLKKRLKDSISDGGGDEINHPNQKNTEHIMKKFSKSEQTPPESLKKVNEPSDIFKDEGKTESNIRTVLTVGEAGRGKSYLVRKFIKSWAKTDRKRSVFTWLTSLWSKANNDVEVIFPINFSELNFIKEKQFSLVGLLNHFFKETKEFVISDYEKCKIVFILDGLDSYKNSLDFDNNEITDVREPASVSVLLTNLIKGKLLPSAQIWITSRPSDNPQSQRLPDDRIDRLTEIRVKPDIASQQKLKSQIKEQFTNVSEGIDKQKTSALLKEIFTDLYIIEGERGEVNSQSETRQVQDAKFKPLQQETQIKYCDIFKPEHADKPVKTVLTMGVAGIGKTFASMKYMLDWAEGEASENIFYTFPLPFRELNLRKEEQHSLEALLHEFFPAMKTSEITDYDKYKILIVLDGFDECRLDLKFNESDIWRDVKTPTLVNVLLANLIQGNLLPNAQIWITSRPAASNNIPPEKVNRVTEVRGFNDEQKEQYFMKRFDDQDLAKKILSHVKKSRSLYIMCHIPVFCWITSKVLEDFVHRKEDEGVLRTLTDMYTHFLLLQRKQAHEKYAEGEKTGSETNSYSDASNDETILSLAKLAFEELEKGNLFTEEHLEKYDVNAEKAAVYSGLFTQTKGEERGQHQKKWFSFVHLSIQEFLAALYVHHTFIDKGENLLTPPPSTVSDLPESDFYKKAVDKALESKNGDWDLFLRFLLGLSLKSNQDLLQELLKKTKHSEETNKETIEYIKQKTREENSDPNKNLNLFYCLNELNDHSLVTEVKQYLTSERKAFENFTSSQWSALTFVLLTSNEKLEEFDLKAYLKSEKVLLGMLPVVKVSQTALLSWCELSEDSCSGLTASVLTSPSSNLKTLDLSHNDLLDSGVQKVAEGLKNLHCNLENLKLAGCQVTEKGCSFLAEALRSNSATRLKHLDLSYNHPGDNGMQMLSAIVDDKDKKLETVRYVKLAKYVVIFVFWNNIVGSSLNQYYGVYLKLTENTAGKRLVLSEGNRRARTEQKVEKKAARPENEKRFKRTQVFCDKDLEGFCYWEVEWKGTVGIAVAYEEVGRTWNRASGLGSNDKSWSLLCSKTGYIAMHGNKSVKISTPPCQKIGVFLDCESGTLSYYSISSSEERGLIHTFQADFTDLLYAGFWFQKGSATLCDI